MDNAPCHVRVLDVWLSPGRPGCCDSAQYRREGSVLSQEPGPVLTLGVTVITSPDTLTLSAQTQVHKAIQTLNPENMEVSYSYITIYITFNL